jgi:peptidoglycan/LPS O-acetylase OafA/YrhL
MAASGTIHEEKRLGVLDGLRGVAVLLVLWYHVWEISWLPAPVDRLQFVPETGFIGVLLFFFLSGFVITYPFVRAEVRNRPAPTWAHFVWRRFTKIVPSYVLSIGVAYALGYAQTQPNAAVVPDLSTHLLFIHTWFPDRYGTINGVLWTLAVEVEFYCIFPLVWWCFKRAPWITAAAMIGIAFAWRTWLAHCCMNTIFPTYEENLPGYLDLFAFGMITSYAFVRFGDWLRSLRWSTIAAPLIAVAGVVSLVELLQNLFGFRLADQWQGVWQIDKRPLLAGSFALIAFGSLLAPRWWQIVLDNAPLRFLATISYNLYLYHQMIARELLNWHIPPAVGDPHYDPGWQVRYTQIAFAVTIAQAAIVTYLFERPILRLDPPRVARTPGGRALRLTWKSEASAERASSKRRSR